MTTTEIIQLLFTSFTLCPHYTGGDTGAQVNTVTTPLYTVTPGPGTPCLPLRHLALSVSESYAIMIPWQCCIRCPRSLFAEFFCWVRHHVVSRPGYSNVEGCESDMPVVCSTYMILTPGPPVWMNIWIIYAKRGALAVLCIICDSIHIIMQLAFCLNCALVSQCHMQVFVLVWLRMWQSCHIVTYHWLVYTHDIKLSEQAMAE